MELGSLFRFLSLAFLLSGQIARTRGIKFGINYGQIANNLPPPTQVVGLLQSLAVSRVKLYDADPNVLSAFLNSNIEFMIMISNDNIPSMTDSASAQAWLKQHVQPYIAQNQITCISVGNEVLGSNDTGLQSSLVPAMQSMYEALVALGMDKQVNISTTHSLDILQNSYPPSSGSFRQDLAQYIQPLLNFLTQTNSPFLINAYPYFAYKANPDTVSLQYVVFEPNPGVRDPNTNLNYDNMLYAQVDSVYAAMKAMGHTDLEVKISETGWPSKGDPDEPGATPENAQAYNGNLLKRIAMNQGTPLKPTVPIDVYVFALFNENLKPGPASERNYGLFYPNGTPVYSIALQNQGGYSPSTYLLSSSAPSSKHVAAYGLGILILIMALVV